MTDSPAHDIHFHFDPLCPFAWQTSRWAIRVADLRGASIGWRFLSLRMVEEDAGVVADAERTAARARSSRLLRVAAAVRASFEDPVKANEAVGGFYTSIGESLWYAPPVEGVGLFGAIAVGPEPAALLERAGLDPATAAAAEDPTWDAVVRAETEAALERTGRDVGTPVIHVDPPHGNALFGPVISTVPDDEAGLALWDAVLAAARVSSFAELKRSKRDPLDLPLLAPSAR